MSEIEVRTVSVNGIEVRVASQGKGPAVLLLHGWPHTRQLWRDVMPSLAEAGYRAVAPDLRGCGGSSRAPDGYDLHTLSDDAVRLLDALHVTDATISAIDAGVPIAIGAAFRHPSRIRGLALGESLIGGLPGAEEFLAHGQPWWFGFHTVVGLAENVIVGREETYIGWFLSNSRRTLPTDVRKAFIQAYSGTESLRCGFEYYRAMPVQKEQLSRMVAASVLQQPTIALIGGVVGAAIHRQLSHIALDLSRVDIADCGHIIPLEQPKAYAKALIAFEQIKFGGH